MCVFVSACISVCARVCVCVCMRACVCVPVYIHLLVALLLCCFVLHCRYLACALILRGKVDVSDIRRNIDRYIIACTVKI